MKYISFSHIKKHPIIYGALVLVVAFLSFRTFAPEDTTGLYETMIVEKTDLKQEVDVTGKVSPAEERDLSFQRGGVVSAVYADVGDDVVPGQRIVVLDSSELQAQLRQAEALVAQEESTLSELEKGSRPEELSIVNTAIENAERSLENAQNTYDNTVLKASTDLTSAYDGALTTAASVVTTAKDALVFLSELQYAHFVNTGVTSQEIANKKATAIYDLFGVSNAGNWTAESVSTLSGGVYDTALGLSASDDQSVIDETLQGVLNALNDTADVLESTPVLIAFSTAEKAELSAQKTALDSAISNTSSKIQVVDVQKAANTSAIASAKTNVTLAENTLLSAQKELALKEAGSTEGAIETQRSRVASAYAQKDLVLAQLATMTISSPIAGVITKQDARKGVFAQAGQSIVSVISKGGYQVEVYIPEIDIAKVQVGDQVTITLDAYSDNDIFDAAVASIDPAETILEGVSTYKVTIVFSNDDDRVRSGMTADTLILTDIREGVFAVPTRAIVTEDGQKYVRVLSNGQLNTVPVSTGLRSSDGRTEITEGLTGGEEVVTFIRN
jgi:RND family efflux transporter MFP subunit